MHDPSADPRRNSILRLLCGEDPPIAARICRRLCDTPGERPPAGPQARSPPDVPGPATRIGSESTCVTCVPLVKPLRAVPYGPAGDQYRTPGGWTVEVVQLDAGDRLRIRQHGFDVADVVNVDDLARWIPAAELAQLERDTLIPAAWPRHPSYQYPARAWACTRPRRTPRSCTRPSGAPVPSCAQRGRARSRMVTTTRALAQVPRDDHWNTSPDRPTTGPPDPIRARSPHVHPTIRTCGR